MKTTWRVALEGGQVVNVDRPSAEALPYATGDAVGLRFDETQVLVLST